MTSEDRTWIERYRECLRRGYPVSLVDSHRVTALLDEIDKLTQQLAESETVRKSIEDNYTRLQRAIATLSESTQDDIADALYREQPNCYHD